MKKIFPLFLLCLLVLSAKGQETRLPLIQEKLQSLKWLAGHWKGSGWIMSYQGKRITFDQQEDIRFKLKGKVLHIEGLGLAGADTVHNVLAVVTYDPQKEQYRFSSYTDRGVFQHDALVEVRPNTLIWKMLTPGGSVRYTIVQNQKGQWFEIGEFSADEEKTWSKFFEMTLDRQTTTPELSKK